MRQTRQSASSSGFCSSGSVQRLRAAFGASEHTQRSDTDQPRTMLASACSFVCVGLFFKADTEATMRSGCPIEMLLWSRPAGSTAASPCPAGFVCKDAARPSPCPTGS